MRQFAVVNALGEVTCTVETEYNPIVEDGHQVVEIDSSAVEFIQSGKVKYCYETETLVSQLSFSNTIGFKKLSVDNAEIKAIDDYVQLIVDGLVWMESSEGSAYQLMSQYYDAVGNVLVLGLGLGIVALAAATKEEVTSVTVVESDPRVISLFEQQGFDTSKITILEQDVYNHYGSYDCVLVDYYNEKPNMGEFIRSEYKLLSQNINSLHWNFYLWQLACKSYQEYLSFCIDTNMDPYSEEVWKNFIQYTAPLNTISNWIEAVEKINYNAGSVEEGLSIRSLNLLFEEAQSAIEQSTLYMNYPGTLQWDYGMYRLGDTNYLAAGLTWKSGDKKFSAKYQNGIITDFYEIYNGEHFSSEINPDTLEPIADYLNYGDTKVDSITREVLQDNIRINGFEDLPNHFIVELIQLRVPFIKNIFYYANKPYGETVEFGVQGLL